MLLFIIRVFWHGDLKSIVDVFLFPVHFKIKRLCSPFISNQQFDHDPRQPAYIATQGPLPHTVADFWQVSAVSPLLSFSWRVFSLTEFAFCALISRNNTTK